LGPEFVPEGTVISTPRQFAQFSGWAQDRKAVLSRIQEIADLPNLNLKLASLPATRYA
jgi:hypothetical protein